MKVSKMKTAVSITIVIGIVVVIHRFGWITDIEHGMRRIILALSGSLYSVSVTPADSIRRFQTTEELESAYLQLEETIKKTEIGAVQFELMQKENEQLRKQLRFLQETPYQYVGAVVSRVVAKDIDPVSNTVVIDRGTQSGVSVGDPVIVGEGILVGKIARVEESMSVVRLINDNQSKVAATVVSKEKSIGLIEGGFGISVRLNFIPQHEVVQVGDRVVTSGLEDGIPRGLLIGIVESVEKEAYQPFQKAVISPSVNLERIQDVSVIIRSTS